MAGVGYRPPRRRPGEKRRLPIPVLALGLAAVAVLVVALAYRGYDAYRIGGAEDSAPHPRVPAVDVSVTPTDAVISIGRLQGRGRLRTDALPPGDYRLRIDGPGFQSAATTITVHGSQAKPLKLVFALKPLPQQLTLRAYPVGARITVRPAAGKALSAKGKLQARLPAGDVVVTVAAPKHATLTRTLRLAGPLDLDLWLDPTGQVVHTVSAFRCVPAPKGVAVTPDGSQMWVTALVTQPSIEAYDRTGRVIGKVDLGKSGAVEVVFNADGSRAYASQMQSACVYEIDTKTYRVLRKFETRSSWTKIVALSPDGKKLYAANWSGDDVSEIDLKSGKCVRRFPTVDTPRGLWPTADGKRLFVAGFGEQSLVGRIAVIDLATGKSRTLFSVKGGAMRHMVADEKRGILLTSDMGKAVVWQTDLRTLKTTRFVKTDSHPNTIDLSPDGKVLVVSCRGANNPKSYYEPGPEWGSIELFDATTGAPLDAIIGGNQCTALDLSADGRTLVFSDFLDNRLHVYDVPDHATLAAAKGGRFAAHEREIRKPGWGDYGDSGGGD